MVSIIKFRIIQISEIHTFFIIKDKWQVYLKINKRFFFPMVCSNIIHSLGELPIDFVDCKSLYYIIEMHTFIFHCKKHLKQ